jgi:hypothetical protein
MSATNTASCATSRAAAIRRQTIAVLILGILFTWPLLTWGQISPQNRERSEGRSEKSNRVTVISERGIRLNQAKINGSIQQNRAEDIDINNSTITGSLFVAGLPEIQSNGNTSYNDGLSESFTPRNADYIIRLNNSNLNRIVSRTAAVRLPDIDIPVSAAGGREDFTINKFAELSRINFRSLRNLTINANAGELRLPPGNYGNFVLNSNVTLILGDDDSTTTTYNLKELVLNADSRIKIVGQVRLNLVDGITLNSNTTVGNNPTALQLNVADGNVVLNSNCQLYATVQAPQGEVILNANSLLQGTVVCKQLTVNNGRIEATTRRNLEPR